MKNNIFPILNKGGATSMIKGLRNLFLSTMHEDIHFHKIYNFAVACLNKTKGLTYTKAKYKYISMLLKFIIKMTKKITFAKIMLHFKLLGKTYTYLKWVDLGTVYIQFSKSNNQFHLHVHSFY